MASLNCAQCLTRPASGLRVAPRITPIITSTAASFSTTAASNAALKPGSGTKPLQVIGKHIRRGKMGQNSKKKRDTIIKMKKPNPGERKAFRKRIVLSNNNAAPVDGLPVLDGKTMVSPDKLGSMAGLPDKLVDQLRSVEAFKVTQNWKLFRKPHMLVRTETLGLMQRMDEAVEQKQTLRQVLVGDKIAGKSTLLLQAMSHAFLNDWVVLNIPEAQELTNSNTEYSPVPGTKPLQFTQPVYVYNLLQQMLKANEDVLKKHKCANDYSATLVNFVKDSSLYDLVASAKEPEVAWPTFQAVWKELTTTPDGPPVLLTVDNLSHIMRISAYRDPNFNLVHAHDLTFVRLVVDALSGKTPLANGGAVVAATSRSNAPRCASMELALDQSEAAAAGQPVPPADPYSRQYDDRVYEALKGIDVFRVSGVSKAEARSLMEYWARSGILQSVVDERTITEKWTLGGNGILGEMERASLLTSRL